MQPGGLEIDGVGEGDPGHPSYVARLQDLGDPVRGLRGDPGIDRLARSFGVGREVQLAHPGVESRTQRVKVAGQQLHAGLGEDLVVDAQLRAGRLTGAGAGHRHPVLVGELGLGVEEFQQGRDLGLLPRLAELVEHGVHLARGGAAIAGSADLAQQIETEVVDLRTRRGNAAEVCGHERGIALHEAEHTVRSHQWRRFGRSNDRRRSCDRG